MQQAGTIAIDGNANLDARRFNIAEDEIAMRSEKLVQLLAVLGDWGRPGEPLYRSLANAITESILRKELVSGDSLPSERQLAAGLGVSRSTVLSAFQLLKESGVIVRDERSGTRVKGLPVQTLRFKGTRTASRLTPGGIRTSPKMIDLSIVAPAPPDALADIIASQGRSLVSERDYHPQGLPALRKLVAARYDAVGLPTSPDQIIITTGAQQAIAIVAAGELSRGDRVLIEDPTYHGAIDAYSLAGARLIGIPLRGGLNPNVILNMALTVSPKLLHITPSHQNPTGIVFPPHIRAEIAETADEIGLTVVEDETLRDLWFDNESPPPVACWSRKDRIITVGSFSKTLWAGLRVGWLRVPQRDIARYIATKAAADLGTGHLGQALVLSASSILAGLIRERAAQLRFARDIVSDLVRDQIPEWRFVLPSGGAFLWINTKSASTAAFQQMALRQGVVCTDGDLLSPTRNASQHIRLALSQSPEKLRLGVNRLAEAWFRFNTC